MAKRVAVNLDLMGNLILNPVFNPLAAAPENANPYYLYTSTASSDRGVMYINVGTYSAPVWQAAGAVLSVNGQTGNVQTYKGAWAASTVYYVGDMVANGGNLYVCKTQHTSSSTFSATNWIGIPPIDHASSGTTYGVGTSTNYGHVKLSDATDGTSDTTGGTAATPKAVKSAYDLANAALPKTGGTMSGNIAMGGNKVTGLADGTSDQDAVTVAQMGEAIATSTGFFRGSFATKAALDAVQWQTTDPSAANYVTNNDYAVVEDDETQNDECWRYVYVTGTGWTAQYRINESPLTPAQIAAINSGITSVLVAQIGTNQTDIGAVKNMIADSEASATAATAHAIGDYFIYNNKLYRATAAISVGGTITPNANCVEVSLEEELKLKAAIASPAFAGTPTAPTAASGTNTTQIATTAFVDAAVKGAVTATTGTIDTSATTVTVNYSGTFVNAYAHQSGAAVVTDVTVNSNNVVFTVAAAPSAAITCVVVAAKAAS